MFEWLSEAFMQRALLAVLLMMPLFSLLGTMVVNNGMAFFSDALGHSALTGVGIGLLLGMADTTVAMVIFAVLFALGMTAIRRSNVFSADTVISVFSSCGMALGLIILSRGGGFSKYQSLLIGDILSITSSQLWMLGAALLAVALLWLFCFNRFLAVSISPSLSRSKKISVNWYEALLSAVLAVAVMLAIRWVGLLMLNAMLVLPAAAARNVARSMRSYLVLTLIFSLFSGVLGLWVSYECAFAAGPMIVLLSGVLFFGTAMIRGRR